MDAELGKDPLSVVARGMRTDAEPPCYGEIWTPFLEQLRNVSLASGEAELEPQMPGRRAAAAFRQFEVGWGVGGGAAGPGLVQGLSQSGNEIPALVAELAQRGEQLRQLGGHGRFGTFAVGIVHSTVEPR